jgi:hypothetical protein
MTISIAPPIQSGFSTLITSDEIAHLFADPGSAPERTGLPSPVGGRCQRATVSGLTIHAVRQAAKASGLRGSHHPISRRHASGAKR